MKSIFLPFYIGFFCCFIGSCTISKRHFGSGYHVEWKKHWDEAGKSFVANESKLLRKDTLYEQTIPVLIADQEVRNSQKVNESGIRAEEQAVFTNLPVVLSSESQAPDASSDELAAEVEYVREKAKAPASEKDSTIAPETKKRVEPLTWVAFSVLLLAMTIFLIPLEIAVANAYILGLIFSLLILGGAVSAFISLKHIKKNPSRYKGKTFTEIILFICFAGIIFAVLGIFNFFKSLL